MTRLMLPPGTASTWICTTCGAINPRTTTTCTSKKHRKDTKKQ